MSDGLRVAGIVGDSITDGPGLRLTLFVQGCPHRCEGCHNPQSWDFDAGQVMSTAELCARIEANPLLTGVTFSGGEPFSQAAELLELARWIRQRGLELAVYTGYTFEELLALGGTQPAVLRLLELTQTLVDGPFVLARRNLELRFRGSENQRILDVAASLERGQPVEDASGRWYNDTAPRP